MLDFQGYGPIFVPVRIHIVQPLLSLEDKVPLAKFPSVYFYVYLSSIRLEQVDKKTLFLNKSKRSKAFIYTKRGRKYVFTPLFLNIPKILLSMFTPFLLFFCLQVS